MKQPASPEGNLEHTLGYVVRAWREFRGWSVTEFAERAGLQKGHVSEIELGKIEAPRRATLRKLANGLGIEEWDLYEGRMPNSDPKKKSRGFAFPARVRFRGGSKPQADQLKRMSQLIDELRAMLDELLVAEGERNDRQT